MALIEPTPEFLLELLKLRRETIFVSTLADYSFDELTIAHRQNLDSFHITSQEKIRRHSTMLPAAD